MLTSRVHCVLGAPPTSTLICRCDERYKLLCVDHPAGTAGTGTYLCTAHTATAGTVSVLGRDEGYTV